MIRPVVLGLVALFAFATSASADSVSFDLNVHFGDSPASGTIKITFDDQGTPGSVLVTMDTSGLNSTTEFITEWYFSYNGNATTLAHTLTDITALGGDSPGVSKTATQSQQADGDGKYNIKISFPTAGSGGGAKRFKDNEIVKVTFTKTGLAANDFNIIAAVGGGNGPFFSAAHVQGLANGKSDWLGAGQKNGGGIPEPSAIALVFLGLGAAFLRRRRS